MILIWKNMVKLSISISISIIGKLSFSPILPEKSIVVGSDKTLQIQLITLLCYLYNFELNFARKITFLEQVKQ